ncbi:MAG: hypothetical protein ACFFD4_26230 [Candidatus Odinarchaeota archaeon]
MFYYIEPEVAGDWGDNIIVDTSVHPPIVTRLHYEFINVWLGDDILETFPCFIVTDRLKKALELARFSGYTIDDVEVSVAVDFRVMYPNRTLPEFHWLKIHGVAGKDDFGIAEDLRLVISTRVLGVLRKFNLEHAESEEF